jgi:hypothetical protein
MAIPRETRKRRGYYKPVFVLALCLIGAACSKPAPEAETPAKSIAPPPTPARPGTTFNATPNPVISSDSTHLVQTSVVWSTNVAHVQVHVESPGGRLFTAGGPKGVVPTGKWVRDGMTFYLQDATAADPNSPSATLASLVVTVQ